MDSSIIVISKFMELDVAGMCVLFKATNSILRNCCFCFVFTINYEHFQKKAMSPHSTTLAWKIPGTAEPGGLPSMGSRRVGHD